MIRLNLVLLVAVLLSAFYLVPLRYQWCTTHAAVHKEQKYTRELANENKVLDVQKRTQAASLRVANIARKRLSMRTNAPTITEYIVRKKVHEATVVSVIEAPVHSAQAAAVANNTRRLP